VTMTMGERAERAADKEGLVLILLRTDVRAMGISWAVTL
jgi:hypothetical protein